MHPIWIFIFAFFALGITGTALANRGKDAETRRKRWLKVWVHLAITVFLVLALQYGGRLLLPLAALLLAGSAFELTWTARQPKSSAAFYLATLLVYLWTAYGFWLHCATSPVETLLFVFLVVFTFDGFSQIAGQLFGRRPLFPVISPNKTYEGLLGGTVMALLTAVLTAGWLEISPLKGLMYGMLFSFAALVGDYLASLYKRRHGIKDYNNLIPGHGGLLDRFDSWLLAGALAGWLNL